MKLKTEHLTIEANGDIIVGGGCDVDFSNATDGFYPPQIATASLPTASGVEGMIVYDTTANKLVVSNGTAWETVTSAT